jgi:uncharacterized protein (TIGR03437 family)
VADPVFGVIYKVTPGGSVSQIALEARDVASDPAGNLFAAARNSVQKVLSDGASSRFAGSTQFQNLGDGGPAVAAAFVRPLAVAFDVTGNLLVADQASGRVRSINPKGEIATVASNLGSPQGIATDLYGNLFVSETGSRTVRRWNGASWSTVANKGDLVSPGPLAADEYGNLYVSDVEGHRVLRIAPSGRIEVMAGTGQRGFQGDAGLAALALLDSPRGLAVDRQGSLYIADSGNHRIRKVSREGIISTVASGLSFPYGVAVSAAGMIAVSEAGSHSVRLVAGTAAAPVAGTGKPGFSGDGGPAAAAQLNLPSALVFDAAGNLYVADSLNRRVRKLTAAAVTPPAALVAAKVMNAASYAVRPIAPGEIVSIFGTGIGPASAAGAVLNSSGTLETQIAETIVRFDGTPAPLLHASENQINVVVPYAVAGKSAVEVEVVLRGTAKARWTSPVADAAPGLFAVSNGSGQVIAVHADGSLNSRSNPAARGSIVTLYATGEGLRTPAALDGRPADALARTNLPVTLKIAGYDAELQYAGAAPGFVGLMQINARVPSGFAPVGEQPVMLKVGAFEGQDGMTLWIR